MSNIIEVCGVCKSYRQGGLFGRKTELQVLQDINLTIEEGACLGLLGSSGCGKSTLGRLVLGLEPPDSGAVIYQNRDLRTLKGQERSSWRREVQVVFQNSHGAVNPRFTAGQIIGEPLSNFERLSGESLRKRVGGLMEKVGLHGRDQDKLPHQFSGGELQRICIARSFASSPKLVVLDEAVSSLDMNSQVVVLDILAEARRESGASFLFISHDVRVIFKIADKLAVMKEGQITYQTSDLDSLGLTEKVTDPTLISLAKAILPSGYGANPNE
ncbi:MAG: ATP-binding cassette domain-containing protein [Deltaproteobacteria bacterium]|jgi:nickel transport system ATP-binding protein|nr:ATP-binding cassette domain-containing protein [Deltaproteobacteria bacterium]